MAAFEVRLDAAAINRFLTARDQPIVTWLAKKGLEAVGHAQRHCPVDTGNLRSKITYEVRSQGGVPIIVIGTNVSYARYVHDGTGLYGPRQTRIIPVSKKALAFTWKRAPFPPNGRGGKHVFASVRGMKGVPYLRLGLEDAFRGGATP